MDDGLSGPRELAIATLFRGDIDDDGARAHALDGGFRDDDRRLAARYGRGGDDCIGGRYA
jgi:hypothetical protein